MSELLWLALRKKSAVYLSRPEATSPMQMSIHHLPFAHPACCFRASSLLNHSVMNVDWNSDLFANRKINLARAGHLFQFDWFIPEVIECDGIFLIEEKNRCHSFRKRCNRWSNAFGSEGGIVCTYFVFNNFLFIRFRKTFVGRLVKTRWFSNFAHRRFIHFTCWVWWGYRNDAQNTVQINGQRWLKKRDILNTEMTIFQVRNIIACNRPAGNHIQTRRWNK